MTKDRTCQDPIYQLRFDDPSDGTSLVRVWPHNETPSGPAEVRFDPDATEALRGAPSNLFANAHPGTGQPLVAPLPPPTAPGQTVSYIIEVHATNAGTAVRFPIKLHWEAPP